MKNLTGRLVVVGEADPRGGPPLDRSSPGRSGARLATILGLDGQSYDRIIKVNLCGRRWDRGEAMRSVGEVVRVHAGRVVVALGRKVASAMGHEGPQFTARVVGKTVVVHLPHPSGRCRAWNDPEAPGRARRVVRFAAGSPVRSVDCRRLFGH